MASLPAVFDTTAVGPTTPLRRKSLSDTEPDSKLTDSENEAVKDGAEIKGSQAVAKSRMSRLAVEKLLTQSSAQRAQHPSFKFSPTPGSRSSAGASGRRVQGVLDDVSARGSPTKKKKSGHLQLVRNDELPAHIALPEKPGAIEGIGAATEDPFARAAGLKGSPSMLYGLAPLAIRARNGAETIESVCPDVAYAAFQPLERKASGIVKPPSDESGIANAGPSTGQVASRSHNLAIERVPSQKRRKDSGGMPDTKRRRNPDEAQVDEPSGNGSVSPVAGIGFAGEPRAGPDHPENREMAALRNGINGVKYEEDETGGTLTITFPGAPPVDVGPKGYIPIERGQGLSPREVVQLFAEVKETCRRLREEDGITATHDLSSMFAMPGDIVRPESLRDELLSRLAADVVQEILGPNYDDFGFSFGAPESNGAAFGGTYPVASGGSADTGLMTPVSPIMAAETSFYGGHSMGNAATATGPMDGN